MYLKGWKICLKKGEKGRLKPMKVLVLLTHTKLVTIMK